MRQPRNVEKKTKSGAASIPDVPSKLSITAANDLELEYLTTCQEVYRRRFTPASEFEHFAYDLMIIATKRRNRERHQGRSRRR